MKFTRKGRMIVGVAMVVAASMCAFPPFYRDFEPSAREYTLDSPAFDGYHFITASDPETASLWNMRIDLQRLLVQILIVAFLTAAALFFAGGTESGDPPAP